MGRPTRATVWQAVVWDNRLAVAGVPLHLDSSSIGLTVQAGVDWKLNDNGPPNADLKPAAPGWPRPGSIPGSTQGVVTTTSDRFTRLP
jgi:hypothetical protein